MTPMVDLGFLLITFFVITTALSKPTVMDLYMPKGGDSTGLGQSNALTVLLGRNNTVYYYHSDWEEAIKAGLVFETNFSYDKGLGEVIREKQHLLDVNNVKGEGRNGLMLLIKADKEAHYENVVKALDEARINEVKKYAVIKLSQPEINFLKGKEQE
jgi:biopolymer transport protein ExbD